LKVQCPVDCELRASIAPASDRGIVELMMKNGTRYGILLFLAMVGFSVAGLTGLSEHVAWLASFCGQFTGSCGEAAQFTLLGLPVWAWGMGFYAVLALSILRVRQGLAWLLAAAAGAELALVYIMVAAKIICVFCLANFLVIFFLVVFSFEKRRSWQMLSVCLMLFLLSVFMLSRENALFVSAAGPVRSEIVAVVAGNEITRGDLEGPLTSRIYDLQLDIFRMKKQRLDQMISERVLQKEAGERGISVQRLIDGAILAGGVEVSEEEVTRYYQQNRNRLAAWQGTDEALRTRIRSYLKEQKSSQKIMDYSVSLYSKYGVAVYLREPEAPLARVSVEGEEVWGPSDASVTVVEFSDYLCPACRQAHEIVKKIRGMYAGRLKWVFKDYPLERHEGAELAAEAARCAGEQDRFWEYQDILYGSKEKVTADRLQTYAEQLGLAGDRFRECLDSRKFKDKVEKDMEEAKKAGIDRTPTFLINGRLIIGSPSLEKFKQLIDQEMEAHKVPEVR
jgi:protein-disulfide isomerase